MTMARVILRVTVSVGRGCIRITIELLPPGAGFQAVGLPGLGPVGPVEFCARRMYLQRHTLCQPGGDTVGR